MLTRFQMRCKLVMWASAQPLYPTACSCPTPAMCLQHGVAMRLHRDKSHALPVCCRCQLCCMHVCMRVMTDGAGAGRSSLSQAAWPPTRCPPSQAQRSTQSQSQILSLAERLNAVRSRSHR